MLLVGPFSYLFFFLPSSTSVDSYLFPEMRGDKSVIKFSLR
jgi:hypothetical protein